MTSSFMDAALSEARLSDGLEVPVGAVVVLGDKIIGRGRNLTLGDCDPTSHAEIVALRLACDYLGSSRLPDCDLYVTLEPCVMCAGAISHARIRRLYFGAEDVKGGAVINGVRFFDSPTCLHSPEIYGGINESASSELLRDFFGFRD